MNTITKAHTPGPWEIVHQTQDGHLGSYCDLKHSIRYDGGQFSIGQRIQDTQEGYVIGQSRARLITAAPELLRELEHALADVKARLYMLPIDGEGVSEQKDILSAQIGRYNSAIQKARGER